MKNNIKEYHSAGYFVLVSLLSVVTQCKGLCNLPGYNGAVQLTGWEGTINSPGINSGMYPNYQDCTWEIKVTPGSKVKVKFESFALEEGSFINSSPTGKKTCLDYVKINDTSGTIFEECGSLTTPVEVTSSGEAMTIQFHSDESGASIGFKASYIGVCEADITETSVLFTPNYPYPPPDGVICTWKIDHSSHLLNIIKALTSVQALPDCGKSPLRIVAENPQGETHELCLSEAAQAHSENVRLVYDASGVDIEPWIGQLHVDVADDTECTKFCSHSSSCQPVTVGTKISYNCVCQYGYKGITCEKEKDSCEPSPCIHGTCTNLPGVDRYDCSCLPDYTGNDCDTLLRAACDFVTCYNSGFCIVGSDGQPYCQCPTSGVFTGTFCDIPIDSAHCLVERDDFPGSLIMWSDTLALDYDTKPCPAGVIGNATRNCILDPRSPTGGYWTRPDLSMCVSPEIFKISQDAQMLEQGVSKADTDFLLNITNRLVNATDSVMEFTPDFHPLFPGDLITAATVMETISAAADRVDVGRLEVARNLTQKYAKAVDNIVDPRTWNTWRNARANLVEDKVSKVVESTQRLIANVVRNSPDLRRKMSTRAAVGSLSDDPTQPQPVIQVATRNIDLRVTQVDHTNAWTWTFNYTGVTSSISLPDNILNYTNLRPTDAPHSIYFARFQSISTLLSISECRYHKELQNDSNLVNSDVISAEILDVPKANFQRLRRPVVITFHLQDPDVRGSLTEQCVFMNMSATSYEDRWSSSGCVVAESNDTYVVCYCYHLTNFAVLMDVYEMQDDMYETHEIVLTYISYIGGCLSILTCLITIIAFQYFKLSNDRVRIHQQFGLSIILVQVFFICVGRTGKDYGTPVVACQVLSIFMHYSLTAMFCWMLVEGIHLYVVLVRVFKQGSHLKKYIAVGWGIPLIVVGISVGAFHDRYGSGDLCWLDHEVLLVCFVPTVGLVVMINTVILVIVIRVMIKSNSSAHKITIQERNNVKMGLKAATVLLPLLGLTWVLGFLAINTDETKVISYVFTYLFTIVNSFQGVLFFTFHCLLNVDVHQAYERRYKRKKRLSYVETTSSRLRKLSEPEFFNGSNNSLHHTHSKSTNTTRSTLTDLSLGEHRNSIPSTDKHPIINMDDMDNGSPLTNLWARLSSGQLPEPDYPGDYQAYSPKRSISHSSVDLSPSIIIPRPHRNSVRFT